MPRFLLALLLLATGCAPAQRAAPGGSCWRSNHGIRPEPPVVRLTGAVPYLANRLSISLSTRTSAGRSRR